MTTASCPKTGCVELAQATQLWFQWDLSAALQGLKKVCATGRRQASRWRKETSLQSIDLAKTSSVLHFVACGTADRALPSNECRSIAAFLVGNAKPQTTQHSTRSRDPCWLPARHAVRSLCFSWRPRSLRCKHGHKRWRTGRACRSLELEARCHHHRHSACLWMASVCCFLRDIIAACRLS